MYTYTYFTVCPNAAEPLTMIFKEMTVEQAQGFKKGLVSTGAYSEEQLTFTRSDSNRWLPEA